MLSTKKTVNLGSHSQHRGRVLEILLKKGGTMKYPVLLEQGMDGCIVVTCPSIHGCISQGRTRAEALANIREAITLMLETIEEEGWEKPLEFLEITTIDIDIKIAA